MSTAAPAAPAAPAPTTPPAAFRRPPYRFSVADYHKMIETGILREGDPVEFIEGIVVEKMPQNPPHRAAVRIHDPDMPGSVGAS